MGEVKQAMRSVTATFSPTDEELVQLILELGASVNDSIFEDVNHQSDLRESAKMMSELQSQLEATEAERTLLNSQKERLRQMELWVKDQDRLIETKYRRVKDAIQVQASTAAPMDHGSNTSIVK